MVFYYFSCTLSIVVRSIEPSKALVSVLPIIPKAFCIFLDLNVAQFFSQARWDRNLMNSRMYLRRFTTNIICNLFGCLEMRLGRWLWYLFDWPLARFWNFRARFASRSHFVLLIWYYLKLYLFTTLLILCFHSLSSFLYFLLRNRLIILIFFIHHIALILENILRYSIRYRVIYVLLGVLLLFWIDLISLHIEDHLFEPFQFRMLITIVADSDNSVARVTCRNRTVFRCKTGAFAKNARLLAILPGDLSS